jgi:phosphocarrier protein
MVEKTITVSNRAGIHARPASLIARTSMKFKSTIYLEVENDQVNAKSIMGLLTMLAAYGTEIKIIAEGEDEQQAVDALIKLFESKFEEE